MIINFENLKLCKEWKGKVEERDKKTPSEQRASSGQLFGKAFREFHLGILPDWADLRLCALPDHHAWAELSGLPRRLYRLGCGNGDLYRHSALPGDLAGLQVQQRDALCALQRDGAYLNVNENDYQFRELKVM